MAGDPGRTVVAPPIHGLDLASENNRTLEGTEENSRVANAAKGGKNENPGALAGASGAGSLFDCEKEPANITTSEPKREALRASSPSAPITDWPKQKFDWLKRIIGANLTPLAKVIATALGTGFDFGRVSCSPGISAIAETVGANIQSVKRALRALEAGGWILRQKGTGCGHFTKFTFRMPICSALPAAFASPAQWPENGGKGQFEPAQGAENGCETSSEKGCKSDPCAESCDAKRGANPTENGCKKHPSLSNREKRGAGAHARPERPAPQCRAVIPLGSDNEAAWNEWLTRRRFLTLKELGQKSSDATGVGWDAPFRMPPAEGCAVEVRIAEKWADWATFRRMERADA